MFAVRACYLGRMLNQCDQNVQPGLIVPILERGNLIIYNSTFMPVVHSRGAVMHRTDEPLETLKFAEPQASEVTGTREGNEEMGKPDETPSAMVLCDPKNDRSLQRRQSV